MNTDLLKRLSEAHSATYHPDNTASSPEKLRILHALVGDVIAAGCRHPDCLDNADERCPAWLTGDCVGPRVGD